MSRIRDAVPGRLYQVREDRQTGGRADGQTEKPPTLFEDVSSRLPLRHAELPFNDYARQPLLPRALSQLGPG